MPTTIAVDAMGADRAPKPEVDGAILAARHYDVEVLLVGQEHLIRQELKFHPLWKRLPVEIVPASEVIGMHEKAAQAVRSKRDSSMRVGLRLVRDGRAAGFVSAGNTGACMATAKMVLGALPGVDRPALAAVFPTAQGTATILIDVGANVDSKPQNLQQFAIMGDVYFRTIFADRFETAHRPRVGVLSVGEEESKGNELSKEAYKLIKELPLNFVGNVEGRDLFNGKADVLVCDGFVGNVALKISEGMAETVRFLLRQSLQATITRQVGYMLSKQAFVDFKKRLDYSEYGGAPLLGIKGVCIISHGSSNGNAIKNAIRVAAEFANSKLNHVIERRIAEASSLLDNHNGKSTFASQAGSLGHGMD
ncbi:MAG TPA: phosphate acyltransferase PlsX [Candidatus Eisenbacteria bacterium]|nr:phosphate acyltransferase PlsX [Candidatus Eisenbacteria bacterium]